MRTLLLSTLFLLVTVAPAWSADKASEEMRKNALACVAKADYVIFNTVDESGFPQTRAMANLHKDNVLAAVKDGKVTLYFITKEGTNKIRQVRANQKVSAYYLDIKNVTSSLYSGNAEEIKDVAVKKEIWADWMKSIYGSPDNADFVVIRLVPTMVKLDVKSKVQMGDL
jgi:Uncharacterized stress protein (general stress protein 26)